MMLGISRLIPLHLQLPMVILMFERDIFWMFFPFVQTTRWPLVNAAVFVFAKHRIDVI